MAGSRPPGLELRSVPVTVLPCWRRRDMKLLTGWNRPRLKTKTDLAVNQFCKIQTLKSRRFESRMGFLASFAPFAKVPRVFSLGHFLPPTLLRCEPQRSHSEAHDLDISWENF